jgi:hypothetical protein
MVNRVIDHPAAWGQVIAPAVALEVVHPAVPRTPVAFDDPPHRREGRVDALGAVGCPRGGSLPDERREPRIVEHSIEPSLEHARSDRCAGLVPEEDRLQASRPGLASRPGRLPRVSELLEGRRATPEGFANRVAEEVRRDSRRDVGDRLGSGRDPDALHDRRRHGMSVTHPGERCPSAVAVGCDLQPPHADPGQAMEHRCAETRQGRVRNRELRRLHLPERRRRVAG